MSSPEEGSELESLRAQVAELSRKLAERKRAEEALRESEARSRSIIETAFDAVIATNRDGQIIGWNPQAEAMFGYSAHEAIGRGLSETIIPARLRQAHAAGIAQVFQAGENPGLKGRREFSALHREGHEFPVELAITLFHVNGQPVLSAFVRDITERKRAAEALQESRDFYLQLLDEFPALIWRAGLDAKCDYFNRSWLGFTGRSLEQEQGDGWAEGVHPDDLERCVAIYLEAFQARQPFEVEYRLRRHDGAYRMILDVGRPFYDHDEAFGGYIGSCYDITERKQAEEALRESERDNRQLFELSPLGLALCRLDGRLIDINEAFARILGRSRAETLGLTYWDITPEKYALQEQAQLESLRATGRYGPYEKEYIHRDGHLVPVRLSGVMIERGGEQFIWSTVEDITEHKQLAEREAVRVKQLRKLYELSMPLSGDPAVVFEHAVRIIGELFTMRVVCLSEIVGQELYFKSMYVNGQTVMDAGHCSLEVTPCATVEQTKEMQIFDRVMERFPQASFLRDHQAFFYCGFPALDNKGHVLAVVCLLDDQPHELSKDEQDLLRIFGQRIALEIERSRYIAEQKRVADELRRSHAFIRQIIDTDPNFIFAKDRDGRFTLVNKALADAYGTTVDKLLGKTDADFNGNREEVAFFRQKDLAVMDSGQGLFIPEEPITDSHGNIRWLQTVKRPILDEEGRTSMILGVATDITERKHMEQALRVASEERERISQDLHDGILQSLFAVGLGLEAAHRLIVSRDRKAAGLPLDQAVGQLNQVIQEVRGFISGLGSDQLQGKDWLTELRLMLKFLTKNSPMRLRHSIEGQAVQALSDEQASHLLYIVQEAVSNGLRHSGAQEARVSLKMLKRGVRLSIRDKGRGFNPASVKGSGQGLISMAARAQKIGGRFTVFSSHKTGTHVLCDLPREAFHASR